MPSPGRTSTFRFDLAAMISTHLRKPKQHPPPNPPPQGGRARKAESPSPLEGEGWGGGWTADSCPEPGLAQPVLRLEGGDRRRLLQGEPDIVEAVQQAVLAEGVDVEFDDAAIGPGDRLAGEIDGEPGVGALLGVVHQRVYDLLRQLARQDAVLEAVVVEDVGEARRDDAAYAEIQQRQGRDLARAAAAEILAGDQDLRLPVGRLVEDEIRVLRPVIAVAQLVEEGLAQAGALDRLQMLLGDDLVGVDIDHRQRRGDAVERGELVHGGSLPHFRSRTSARRPVMAAAAAIAGLIRWVRPPLPWRPSKLRFEVDAQRSPGASLSGFMARHIEQPGSRHSKPAARKIRSRPSSSAWCFTRPEPGTTMALTPAATLRPWAIAAAARRSSMRPLVQEPMKTRCTGTSLSLVPGMRPIYSSERAIAARRLSSASSAGFGTLPVIGSTSCGLVPQVTCGAIVAASITTSVSYFAPGSEGSVCQNLTACSHAAPLGACGRPLRYANVVSSGAMRPARAPPSMVMLHTVMRPSIESLRMALPAYSMTWPVPPAVPMRPMMPRMRSLAVMPRGSSPSTRTSMFLAGCWISVCVASTCSTSDVPMPKASAPKAPCVAVWLSPQTMVMPGWVMPCSGPMMWTMPWRMSFMAK